jgi:hypothetical protein
LEGLILIVFELFSLFFDEVRWPLLWWLCDVWAFRSEDWPLIPDSKEVFWGFERVMFFVVWLPMTELLPLVMLPSIRFWKLLG